MIQSSKEILIYNSITAFNLNNLSANTKSKIDKILRVNPVTKASYQIWAPNVGVLQFSALTCGEVYAIESNSTGYNISDNLIIYNTNLCSSISTPTPTPTPTRTPTPTPTITPTPTPTTILSCYDLGCDISASPGGGAIFTSHTNRINAFTSRTWNISSIDVVGGSGYIENSQLNIVPQSEYLTNNAANAILHLVVVHIEPNITATINSIPVSVTTSSNNDNPETWGVNSITIPSGGGFSEGMPVIFSTSDYTIPDNGAIANVLVKISKPTIFSSEILYSVNGANAVIEPILTPYTAESALSYLWDSRPMWEMTGYTITNPGSGYNIGDKLAIKWPQYDSNTQKLVPAQIVVSSVNSNGGILSVNIILPGTFRDYSDEVDSIFITNRGKYYAIQPGGIPSSVEIIDSGSYSCKSPDCLWTARNIARTWTGIATNSDGTVLVAVTDANFLGGVFTSSNEGVTWIQRSTTVRDWWDVGINGDGTVMVAVLRNGFLWMSKNSGVNWTAITAAGNRSWRGVAISNNGLKIVGVCGESYPGAGGEKIYTSIDGGISWADRAFNSNWSGVASSLDGNKLVAIVNGGKIYTSSDSGLTWIAQESDRNWNSVTSNDDGTKLAATTIGGKIYISSDSGLTWIERENDRDWKKIVSNNSGTILAAITNGPIYISTDSGINWKAIEGSDNNWSDIAINKNGNKLVAVAYGGQIYTCYCNGWDWLLTTSTPTPTPTPTLPSTPTPTPTPTAEPSTIVISNGMAVQVDNDNQFGNKTILFNGGQLYSSDETPRIIPNNIILGGDIIIGREINTGNITFTKTFNLGSQDRLITGIGISNVIIDSVILGSGGLRKGGWSTLTLSSPNFYTGQTLIYDGCLALSEYGDISYSSSLSLNPGVSFDISQANGNCTIQLLIDGDNSSQIILGNNNLRTVINSYSVFGGVINGNGGFVKAGSDRLELTSIQSFTGPTVIESGQLLLASGDALASSSLIQINNGASIEPYYDQVLSIFANQIIGGYGTILGPVIFNFGSILSLGNNIGSLINDGSTTFNGGMHFLVKINDASGTKGINPGWDYYEITGNINLVASIENPIIIDLKSISGLLPGEAINFDSNSSYEWLIIQAADEISTFNSTSFEINTTNFLNLPNYPERFSIVRGDSIGYGSNQLYIIYNSSN